jgi:hypothetical protein
MPADRIEQIEAEIDEILAQPLPDFPQRYIPRERLHALMTELLTLQGFAGVDARQIDLAARKFAIDKVPQNLFSYPMAKRETRVMAVNPNYREEYLKSLQLSPPTSPEVKAKQMADLLRPWGSVG